MCGIQLLVDVVRIYVLVHLHTVAHMIAAWEGLLKDAVKMQRQLMKNATVVFAFIEVSMAI